MSFGELVIKLQSMQSIINLKISLKVNNRKMWHLKIFWSMHDFIKNFSDLVNIKIVNIYMIMNMA